MGRKPALGSLGYSGDAVQVLQDFTQQESTWCVHVSSIAWNGSFNISKHLPERLECVVCTAGVGMGRLYVCDGPGRSKVFSKGPNVIDD